MELPKPIYEILPVIYLITAATTVTLGETTIRFLPVVLFCLVALMISYMRLNHRFISTRNDTIKQIQQRREQNLKKSRARSNIN